jgi:hypothetical protein
LEHDWRMWRDSNPRWALARHQIKSLARSPLRSHIRSVCLCCSFCFVLVVGDRGRIRTFCHPVIGRGPRHSDSLPLMVRSAGIETAAFAMSKRRSPAELRTRCWYSRRDSNPGMSVCRTDAFVRLATGACGRQGSNLQKVQGLSPARLPVPPRPRNGAL